MIKLVGDTIDRTDINKLIEWLSQDPIPQLTKGDKTLEFEKKFASYIGAKYCLHVNSGSAAILLSLFGALEGNYLRNKKIIVPALSWLTDVSSPIQLGMEPILCDCNMHDLSLDLDHLERLCEEHEPASIILVSVLGLVPDLDRITRLSNKYNFIVFEDNCESLGSKYKGEMLGSHGFLASFYSGFYGHQISCGTETGLITTDDKDFYELLTSIRSHGMIRDNSNEFRSKQLKEWNIDEFSALYTFFYPGFNERSNNIAAFFGIHQLDKINMFSEIRNRNFKLYQKYIHVNELKLKDRNEDFVSNFAYPMVSKYRNRIVRNLKENDVEVRPLIAGSMGLQPFWVKRYGETHMTNADKIHKYGFYLPNHQDLMEEQIRFISDIVNNS